MSAPGLRARSGVPTIQSNDPISTPPTPLKSKPSTSTDEDGPTHLSLLDILRMSLGALLLSSTLSYFITGSSLVWNYPGPGWTRWPRVKAYWEGPLNLTDAQLSLYNGTAFPHLPILLALNGTIYDVSASPHTYGPGGGYHFFAGRDATRAFVTGCFEDEEQLVGDLRGVEGMFISEEDEEDGGGKGEGMGERKKRREQEKRLARRKVKEAVEGWRGLFEGGKEGRYFRRGVVWRGEGSGWMGWGEPPELCERAREGRGRRGAGDV
ncbi:MAG: hypothetical protein OHK93_006968 [Ramalina farinacea]|uniref:Cytochrome b5 heme-binding domain-containing protein n=1 Tax=Ramalina farinacea TaxID=258253 RepID=A0AA43TX70_9LECA|nr:hypothetical protein [Ramalina farinacea]